MRTVLPAAIFVLGALGGAACEAQTIRVLGGTGAPGGNVSPNLRVDFIAGAAPAFDVDTTIGLPSGLQVTSTSGQCFIVSPTQVRVDLNCSPPPFCAIPSGQVCSISVSVPSTFRPVGNFVFGFSGNVCSTAGANCTYQTGSPLVIPVPAITTNPVAGSTVTITGTQGAVTAPTSTVTVSNPGQAGSVLIADPPGGSTTPLTISPVVAQLIASGTSRNYTLTCGTGTAGSTSRLVTFFSNVGASTVNVVCNILVPPTLLFSPAPSTPITVPATAASTANTTIGISTTGGQAGAVRTLTCTVPPGFVLRDSAAVNINGAARNILTGATNQMLIGCPPVAPPPGNLSCTQSSGGPTLIWPLTCQSNPLFSATPVAGTAINLNGTVGGTAPSATIDVLNTGTETTSLNLAAPTGLSGALSISPNSAQSIVQGSPARRYTVTCATSAAFSGTQTLTLAHNAPNSPATYSITCNVRTPPTLNYAPEVNFPIVIPASQPLVATQSIAVSTSGGDDGQNRPLSCSAPAGYLVAVSGSPVPTGGSATISLGCGLPAPAPGRLTCTEGFSGATPGWDISCVSAPAYSSQPRPSTPFGVYGAIGDVFAQGAIVVTNRGTNTLNLSSCQIAPPTGFALSLDSSIGPTQTGNITIDCTLPPVGTVTVAALTCNTNDNNRPQVLYRLACISSPQAQVGSSASPTARLSTPSADGGANLGMSASAGQGSNGSELIVVGAPFAGDDQAGRVFVYVQPAGSQSKRIAGEGGALARERLGKPVAVLAPPRRTKHAKGGTLDKFGAAVTSSPDGSIIVVGAPDGGNAQTGSVFVFSEPVGGWDDLGNLTPVEIPAPTTDPSVVPTDFGNDVAFSDDGMLVIGAPGAIVNGVEDAGAVFTYSLSGPTPTQMGGPIVSETPAPDANFGFALDSDDGMLAIGSPGENNNTGAAYMYEFSGGTVGQGNRQEASNGQVGDKWGTSVAVGGNTIVVGAPNDDTAAGADSGSATVFMGGEGNTVMPLGVLIPPAGGVQGAGAAVDTNGEVIVLGAPFADLGGQSNRGTVLLYDFESALLGGTAPVGGYENALGQTAAVQTAGDEFGSAVAVGTTRIIVGAPKSDEGSDLDEGRADPFVMDRIFRGSFDR
jgi:hypothetical protein